MNDIQHLREKIDEIDTQLLALFEERMAIVREVGRYKAERGLPIFVPDRERELLTDKLAKLADKTLAQAAEGFFRTLMNVSKDEQQRIAGYGAIPVHNSSAASAGKIAYQGVAGAYGEQAAKEYFGESAALMSCARFEDVFSAVAKGEAKYGVVPIENSTGGSINEVYDLLGSYGCVITGEHVLKVEHVLLSVEGATIEDIRSVYSHEQGLRQCAHYLAGRGWNLIPYHNTAVSAQFVAESGRKDYAAIASRRAAEHFKLHILAPDIQDRNDNYTRFIIVSAHQQVKSGRGKVSIAFTVRHESGSLHAVLKHFAQRSLNLCKIESRNIPGKSWEYRFYLDFEGEIDRAHIEQVMEELKPLTVERQLLGYYPSANNGGSHE